MELYRSGRLPEREDSSPSQGGWMVSRSKGFAVNFMEFSEPTELRLFQILFRDGTTKVVTCALCFGLYVLRRSSRRDGRSPNLLIGQIPSKGLLPCSGAEAVVGGGGGWE